MKPTPSTTAAMFFAAALTAGNALAQGAAAH